MILKEHNMSTSLEIAKEVINIEANEIANMKKYLTDDFEQCIDDISNSNGKFIICGMGKSGLIGKKIAATLASTGTPSFFLHPGEAYHGDLGMIEKEDIILLISNSGETDEVLKVVPFLQAQGNIIVSMTGNPKSSLALNSKYHLNTHVEKEACPLQLAPTSSTTACLVMGDVLAVCLMKRQDFQEENFALFHPGGSLGRRLLMKIENIMQDKNLPVCSEITSIKEVVHVITTGKLGLAVVQDKNAIKGIITDGDIRRAMEEKEDAFFSLCAKDLMSNSPLFISPKAKLIEAEKMMEDNKVNSLLVTQDAKLLGVVQIYDLSK